MRKKILLDLPEKLQNIHFECVSERHSLVELFHFCFHCNILLMFLRLYFGKSLGHWFGGNIGNFPFMSKSTSGILTLLQRCLLVSLLE